MQTRHNHVTIAVLSGVERNGPPDGGPARVPQTGRVAGGGAWHWQTDSDRRGESADFPVNLRRRTCRVEHNDGVSELSRFGRPVQIPEQSS